MARTAQHAASFQARCDFCGRECDVSQEWMPGKCPHCGRVHFPATSRSRLLVTSLELTGLALLTGLVWLFLL
jgi:predicted RNA-binding Zn-ribbon protein involved in translation (DUF1610 family)